MGRQFRYSSHSYQALRNNTKHQFAMSHALSIFESNAVYTFIPKIACSTMRYSIAHANGCVDNLKEIGWIHRNNYTFSVGLKSAATPDYTFTILRCPFDRLLSAFIDKIIGIDPESLHYCLYRRKNKPLSPYDITFDSFVNDLAETPSRLFNAHWRPQVNFLLYKHYDDIFSLKDFSFAKQTLKEKVNLDIYDTRNALGHDTTALIEDESITQPEKRDALELYLLKNNGIIPKKQHFFTDENIGLIRKIYQDDIAEYTALFGKSKTMDQLGI